MKLIFQKLPLEMKRIRSAAVCLLLATGAISAQTSSDPTASAQPALAAERTSDLHTVVPNVLNDQKKIWTFPARVVKGKNLAPVLGTLAVTGALIASDPHTASYFRRTDTFSPLNSGLNGYATAAGIVVVPAAFYLTGMLRSDQYAKNSAWLAGEALVDSEIVNYAIKTATQRRTPGDFVDRNGNLSDNWFDAKGSPLSASGSFPSGHSVAAFSVATVIARRYGQRHRWVPFVCYGLAGTVAFSRLTTSAHYPSDVFMGAVLGYSVARFAVLRQ